MNQQFYEIIDNTIKQGINCSALSYLIQVGAVEQQLGTLFDLPSNMEYILKRFINGCMSTDPQIRFHSSTALQKWNQQQKIQPNMQKTVKYIIDASNYKNSENKKSQSQAYAVGRLLVSKTIYNLIKNNQSLFQSIYQVGLDYPHLQQQVIEVLYLITCNKTLKLKFKTINPSTKSSKFLHRLLLHSKNVKCQSVTLNQFKQVLQIQTQQHQKRSIVLYYCGKYLNYIVNNPTEFFRMYANKFLDNDSQNQVDLNEIYSIMTVLKGYLDFTTITQQNYSTHFDKKIIEVWLQQIRVLNKKMKNLAKQISIKFQSQNSKLAYHVLVDLHENGVYMDNISQNHPFAQLYLWVDVDAYWKYLFGLCIQNQPKSSSYIQNQHPIQQNSQSPKKVNTPKPTAISQQNPAPPHSPPIQQSQQQQQATYYNQIQYFIKLRYKQISIQYLCKTLTLLLNKYHIDDRQKEKQLLYLCINLCNLICKINNNKNFKFCHKKSEGNHYQLNKKMIAVLRNIDMAGMRFLNQEQKENFNSCILWVKKNLVKISKQNTNNQDNTNVDFFNFYNSLIFFSLIYPDEIQTCSQLKILYKDFQTLYKKKQKQEIGIVNKKVKKQKDNKIDNKKSIHVLTDIFISLMTKPPAFLSQSIQYLYLRIIPFLDAGDVGNMLAVIGTPDAEFIQQI